MENKKSIGVVLCRFQPMHLGHLHLIKHAVDNNDIVVVIIGSADKINERNPIRLDLRDEIVTRIINEEIEEERLEDILISHLDDYTDESDNSFAWGDHLYKHIRDNIAYQEGWEEYLDAPINIHYSDNIEIIKQWFKPEIPINVVHFDRESIHEGVSSTKIRKMITDWDEVDYSVFQKFLPKGLSSYLFILKHIFKSYEY